MKKTLQIEIGRELRIVNAIGAWMIFLGILVFLITGIIILSGNILPLEIKLIYFVEVLSKNFYLTFLCSVIMIIIGAKLIRMRKYELTDLQISNDKMVFLKGKERIELLNNKIHKFLPQKSSWNKKKRLIIKTIGLKKYESQMSELTYSELTDLYSEKLSE